MVAYQCLRCRAAADESGCPSCGAGPDPLGIQLGHLAESRATLDRREYELRQQYADIGRRRQELDHRAAQVWAEISRRGPLGAAGDQRTAPPVPEFQRPTPPAAAPVTQPAGPPPQPTGPQPGRPAHARPETSTRSVQTILLILGGLLLGVAAIVFTAVAWANFGIVGRAAILGVITLIALAVPFALRQRELTATAETIASLALLLVLLDGYAAWTVNLAGVQQLRPSGYAALVFGVTAAVAAGYGTLSRLAAPWFAGLLAAQPVLPLVAAAGDASALGHAAAFAALCGVNLALAYAVTHALRRSTTDGGTLVTQAQRLLGMLLAGMSGLVASVLALVELISATRPGPAVLAGAVLLGVVTLGALTAVIAQRPTAIRIASGVAVATVVLVVARPLALAYPGYGLLAAAAATVLVWGATVALPEPWRPGAAIGSRVTAGAVALPAAAYLLIDALWVLAAAAPPWHANLTRWHDLVPGGEWRPLMVVVLLSAAALALVRGPLGRHLAVAGLGLVALGATAALSLPWWSPLATGGALGLALIATGVYGATEAAAVRTVVGVPLLLYGVGAALARPWTTAIILAAVVLGGAVIAVLGRVAGTDHGRVIGGLASASGIAVLSLTVWATGATYGWPEAAAVPGMTGAAALGLLAAGLLRHADSPYVPYAVIGVAATTAVATVAALASTQPAGPYAAVAVLFGVGNGMLLLPNRTQAILRLALSTAIPGVIALLSALPAALAPAQAYLWTVSAWRGDGDSTRELLWLRPEWYATGWDPATLLLLTGAAGLATLGLAGRGWVPVAVIPGMIVTALTAPVAYDLPWPALPVIALGIAVVAGLSGALLSRPAEPSRLAVLRLSGVIWPVTGSLGLANCLATSTATLVSLATVTGVALVAALAGRGVTARVAGWVVAGSGAALFAHAAGLVAELGRDRAPYGVIAVAAALLGAAAVLGLRRRAAETRTTELLSFGVVGFAVLTALPELTTIAVMLAGYGALLGLSALRPGRIGLAFGGVACELVAWWIFLGDRGVELWEAYTLPFALTALVGGLIGMRRRPRLDSWRGYGVALAAAFLPSVALILQGDAAPLRRLLLGVAAVVVLILGAVRRRQAPVVAGSAVLVIVSLRELAALWDVLPRWLPLALAGLLLVALGATYEQRRRDMRRLRQALARMR